MKKSYELLLDKGFVNLEHNDQLIYKLTPDDFANSFGITLDELPAECKALIQETDFRYKIIEGTERDQVILNVLKKIDTNQQIIGAPERRDIWQKETNKWRGISHGPEN